MHKNGGIFFGTVSMANNQLIGIPAPTSGYSAVNKTYVDNEIVKVKQNISDCNYILKTGGTMTGDLILPDYAPINVNPVGGGGMRARGGDLTAKSIPSVGGLIEYLCSGVGTFDFFDRQTGTKITVDPRHA